MGKRLIILGIALAGTALVAVGCGGNDSSKAAKAAEAPASASEQSEMTGDAADAVGQVGVIGQWVPVQRADLRQYTTSVGTLRARQTTRVSAQVSGRVEAVLVDVGDSVKAGDALVNIDSTFFEIEKDQLQAGVEAAKAGLEAREAVAADRLREKLRQEEIFSKGVGSPQERDSAVAAYQAAQANVNESKARLTETQRALRYAEERLSEAVVRAPYDGVITRRMVDVGEYVASQPVTNLLEIQEVDVIYLEFSLPQELLSLISVGTPVEHSVEGASTSNATGEIAVIFPAVDEATRSFRCRVVVDNKNRRLRPGLLAAVRIVQRETRQALAIPRSSVRENAAGYAVTILSDGRPVVRPVEVGMMADDSVEILSGLTESDQVLVAQRDRR